MTIIKAEEITLVPTESLVPHPRNRNRHSVEQLQWLAKIIKFSGFREPINVSLYSGYIVCGHARWEAAKILGMPKVPIILEDYGSESEEYQHLTADNEISRMAELDFHGLKTDLVDIGFDLDTMLLGIALDGPAGDKENQDKLPDTKESIVKYGDVWQLGRHIVMCGDSADPKHTEYLYTDKKYDMLYTDPPYGVDYSKKQEKLNNDYGGARIEKKIVKDTGIPEDLWHHCLKNVIPYRKDHFSYYISSPQGRNMVNLITVMEGVGYPLRQILIWNKNNHVVGGSDYMYKHEPILYGRTRGTHFFKKGNQNKSVIDVPRPTKNDLHPTMKPVELIENLIMNSTDRDMRVLDPFLGSGSTLITCEKTGRICHGMEIDPNYCDVIISRWEEFTGEKAVKLDGSSSI